MERTAIQARYSLSLGEAQMLVGRLEEAHTLAEHTLAHAREHQEQNNQAYALRLLGDIAVRREPLEQGQGEAHYRQALALAVVWAILSAFGMKFWPLCNVSLDKLARVLTCMPTVLAA